MGEKKYKLVIIRDEGEEKMCNSTIVPGFLGPYIMSMGEKMSNIFHGLQASLGTPLTS